MTAIPHIVKPRGRTIDRYGLILHFPAGAVEYPAVGGGFLVTADIKRFPVNTVHDIHSLSRFVEHEQAFRVHRVELFAVVSRGDVRVVRVASVGHQLALL